MSRSAEIGVIAQAWGAPDAKIAGESQPEPAAGVAVGAGGEAGAIAQWASITVSSTRISNDGPA